VGSVFFCIFVAMDLIKDIFINLLSDAIWAALALAYLAFLKKSSLFPIREQLQKKLNSCDLLLKKIKVFDRTPFTYTSRELNTFKKNLSWSL